MTLDLWPSGGPAATLGTDVSWLPVTQAQGCGTAPFPLVLGKRTSDTNSLSGCNRLFCLHVVITAHCGYLLKCASSNFPTYWLTYLLCTWQVLGCHAKYTTDHEKWPQHYPQSDGNACQCYNYYGVHCVASCASNVRNHEVRHQYGTGNITVTCSPGNFVLGCGMRPKFPSDDFEAWRIWAVKTLDSCQCYDYFGVTCYALCGQLT